MSPRPARVLAGALTAAALLLVALGGPAALADDAPAKPAKPAESTPEATLAKAFTAALASDFDAYLETIHPFHKSTDEERASLEKYSWRRFVKHVSWYLDGDDPKSFEVVKRDGEGAEVRLFLKDKEHEQRMPVPVRLARKGDTWFITANSL